jgi:TRAP-type uncharacterized transport system substrate-binding protein
VLSGSLPSQLQGVDAIVERRALAQVFRLPALLLWSALMLLPLSDRPAFGQSSDNDPNIRSVVNRGTIGILTGPAGGTAADIAADLQAVLDCVDGLRILPITGRGSINTVRDLLYLKGVDMAVVTADVLDHVVKNQLFASDIKQRLNHIARLFDQEVHLLARPGITSIGDLAGRMVNVGTGEFEPVTANRIFAAAGIEVRRTRYDQKSALARLQAGQIDAMLFLAGRPSGLLAGLPGDSGLTLLPVPMPGGEGGHYQQTMIDAGDYPHLIEEGALVRTVAVPTVLASFDWPQSHERYQKYQTFATALFERFSYLRRPGRHPKWQEMALTASLSGWRRFVPAEALADALRHDDTADPLAGIPLAASALPRTDDLAFETFLIDYGIAPANQEEKRAMLHRFQGSPAQVAIESELAFGNEGVAAAAGNGDTAAEGDDDLPATGGPMLPPYGPSKAATPDPGRPNGGLRPIF